MENVNKQLLDALKEIDEFSGTPEEWACHAPMIARAAIAAAEQAQQVEPVAWQFYEGEKWWNGDDRIKDHRKNTEAAGIPTRDLYTQPPAVAVAVPDGWRDVIEQAADKLLDSCAYDLSDRLRAMLAADMEQPK